MDETNPGVADTRAVAVRVGAAVIGVRDGAKVRLGTRVRVGVRVTVGSGVNKSASLGFDLNLPKIIYLPL